MKNFCDCCNMTYNERICYICDYEYEYFLDKANICGIGLGYKIKNGISTLNTCLKVFASEKIPSNELPPEDLVPPIYKGIQTDVIQSGTFKTQTLYDRVRPVLGGYGIGPASSNYFGTFGCLVTDHKNNYILSNNHVLADCNNLSLGTPILQPGLSIGGVPVKDEIAQLSKFIPIKFIKGTKRPVNYIDCAIAKITDNNAVSSEIESIGTPKGTRSQRLGQLVKKVGAVTELTPGIIDSINATMVITVDKNDALFKKQIVAAAMSKHGDSGAILLNDNDYALGMLMGGNNDWSIFNGIGRVLAALNVSIVTN